MKVPHFVSFSYLRGLDYYGLVAHYRLGYRQWQTLPFGGREIPTMAFWNNAYFAMRLIPNLYAPHFEEEDDE